MSRFLQAEVTVKGVTFQVSYAIHGENHPADEINPPEREEAVLDAVFVGGEDLTGVLAESVLEKIEEALQELLT